MTRAIVTMAAGAALLCAGTALATPTAQQKCDYARITAWKVFTTCVDQVVAKDAKGVLFDEYAAFAKCRHAYFKKWTAFQQPSAALSGTPCFGARFTNNGTTATDNLTALVWEKKTSRNSIPNEADPHDSDNTYSWSIGTNNEDGTAFTTFLADPVTGLNVAGFAGANGWRLPTLVELQSLVLDFPCKGVGGSATCTCGSDPCIDSTVDAGTTKSWFYWTATSYLPDSSKAWLVYALNGYQDLASKDATTFYARAVRGGL